VARVCLLAFMVLGVLLGIVPVSAPSSALDIGRPAWFVEIFVQLSRLKAILLVSVFGWAFHL